MTSGEHSYRRMKESDVRRVVDTSDMETPGISAARVDALASHATVPSVGSEEPFGLGSVLEALTRVASDMEAEIVASVAAGRKRIDAFTQAERKHCVRWYEALENVPVSVQEDYGFWLYLTVGPLAGVLVAGGFVSSTATNGATSDAESAEGDFSDGEGRITARHIGASKRHDVLAHRMFVTGRLSKHLSDTGAAAVPLAELGMTNYHEMHSSHILGGSVRSQPAMQAAMLAALSPKAQDEARAMVSGRINPVRFVTVPELLSKEDSAELVEKILQ